MTNDDAVFTIEDFTSSKIAMSCQDKIEHVLQTKDTQALMAALAMAQSEIEHVAKDAKNPHFKSKYATLASVFDVCRKPFSRHGLAILQPTVIINNSVYVATTLCHKSGQWVRSYYPVQTERAGSQGLGSGLTYARRYALMSMIGVAPEDDDGEGTTNRLNTRDAAQDKDNARFVKAVDRQPPAASNMPIRAQFSDQAVDTQSMIERINAAETEEDLVQIKKQMRDEFNALSPAQKGLIQQASARKTSALAGNAVAQA